MIIVGYDFHPIQQQVADFDYCHRRGDRTRLVNGNGDAEGFAGSLSVPSLVGVESLRQQSMDP